MRIKSKVGGGLLLAVVGIGTITLFQNCSAGSLPAGLNQTTAGSTGPTASGGVTVAALPFVLSAASTSVTAGQTVILSASGGTPPYRFAASCGGVTSDPVAGTLFQAPSTAGSCVVTATDGAGQSANTTLSVIAAAATTPVSAVTAVSKLIYRFFNSTLNQHVFADTTTVNEGGQLEGPVYRLMTDGTSGAVPFYRCRGVLTGSLVQYMDTTAADCGGLPNATPVATIGYIYPNANVPGTQPLYRFRVTFQASGGADWGTSMQDHLEQLSPNPPAAGWVSDGVVGYVPTN